MNNKTTLEGIEEELKRLNQESLMPIIQLLDNNYKGYPLEDECHRPAEAILLILQSLDLYDCPEERFVHRVCELDCFSYRAFYKDEFEEAVYWNPLEESIEAYEARSTNKTVHYQVDVEHPAKDIIRMWLYTRIKQQRK
jgi:hypothetical protein